MKPASMIAHVMLISVACHLLRAAEPPSTPFIKVEPDMHTSSIRGLSVDATGRYALTCSEDKTARLWEVPAADDAAGELRALACFRPPSGDMHEGKLFCCSLSPDGSIAAVAGWTGYEWDKKSCVYLFDTATGRMVRRITGLSELIQSVAFSSSGRWLAVTQAGNHGLRIFRADTGAEVARDTAYPASCFCVTWYQDDVLVTTCGDGKVRLYANVGKLLATAKGLLSLKPDRSKIAGLEVFSSFQKFATEYEAQVRQRESQPIYPMSARFSPDGNKIAVGFDSHVVSVVSTKSLSIVTRPSSDLLVNRGSVDLVEWDSDGELLFAAGGSTNGPDNYCVNIWRKAGAGEAVDAVASSHPITALARLPDGRLLWASSGPSIGVIDNKKKRVRTLAQPPLIDHRGLTFGALPVPSGLRVSADAWTISFGGGRSQENPSVFQLTPPRLSRGELKTPENNLRLPFLNPLFLLETRNSQEPFIAGGGVLVVRKSLPLTAGEVSLCATHDRDQSVIILGTTQHLRRYDSEAKPIWQVAAPAEVISVVLSEDGTRVVAAYGDGTIRWHQADSGRELLALFVHADRRRWVMWTPEGYYQASAGAEDFAGWHQNRQSEEGADFFPLSRFRPVYHRPDLIERMGSTWTIAETVTKPTGGSIPPQQQKPEPGLSRFSPPVVTLEGAGISRTIKVPNGKNDIKLQYHVRRTGPSDVTSIEIRLNGRPLMTGTLPPSDQSAEVEVPLPLHINQGVLSVIARDGETQSEATMVRIVREKPSDSKPVLYAIALGANTLKANESIDANKDGEITADEITARFPPPLLYFMDLPGAKTDVELLRRTLTNQNKEIFSEVVVRTLEDDQATVTALLNEIKKIELESKHGDVLLLSLSCHGLRGQDGYWMILHDFDSSHPNETVLKDSRLLAALSKVKASPLLLMGSCEAGAAFGREASSFSRDASRARLGEMMNTLGSAEHGISVLTAVESDESAIETDAGSLFMTAVTEALDGKANKLGLLTFSRLHDYLSKRVPELATELGQGQRLELHQSPAGILARGTPDLELSRH